MNDDDSIPKPDIIRAELDDFLHRDQIDDATSDAAQKGAHNVALAKSLWTVYVRPQLMLSGHPARSDGYVLIACSIASILLASTLASPFWSDVAVVAGVGQLLIGVLICDSKPSSTKTSHTALANGR